MDFFLYYITCIHDVSHEEEGYVTGLDKEKKYMVVSSTTEIVFRKFSRERWAK